MICSRYYLTARGYEVYLRVFTSKSRSFAALTREMSSWTREDKIHIHKRHIIFCLYLYKHTNDDIFDDFPKISEDFPKWFWRKDELFQTFFRHFPKITKDFWRQPKISKERPIFQSYSNTSKYFLMDYVTIAMVIILVTMAVTSHDSCCPIGCQIRHVLGILCKGLQWTDLVSFIIRPICCCIKPHLYNGNAKILTCER